MASEEELSAVAHEVRLAQADPTRAKAASTEDALVRAVWLDAFSASHHAAFAVSCTRAVVNSFHTLRTLMDAERLVQCQLLRDIVGPSPFRPSPPLEPLLLRWSDGVVVKIARMIYDGRCFEDMPALEEAGCDNEEILAHCHQQGKHARGCWLIDCIVGKK